MIFCILLSLIFSFNLLACEYSLPFRVNTTHRTLQGFNGDFSHQAPLQYGVDFEMKEGTEIYAARSGVVLDVKSDSFLSGKSKAFLDKSNFIKILHSDKTIAFYAHLKKDGVMIKKDDSINEGQLIGFSGCTGFCDGPHLHFEVYLPAINKHRRVSQPIRFIAKEGILTNIERQKKYTRIVNPRPCQ